MSAAARRVLAARLHNQWLDRARRTRRRPSSRSLCAMQAQDFIGAKWAIGLRAHGLDDAAVEAAFNAGEILRTHVMRPTWHFVTPADIRWMLSLTAPRVHQASAFYYRQHGLDARTLSRAHRVLASELAGGRFRTRTELAAALAARGDRRARPASGAADDPRRARAGDVQRPRARPAAHLRALRRSGAGGAGAHAARSRRRARRRATSPATGRRRCATSSGGRGSRWRRRGAASSRRLPRSVARALDGFTYWATSWETPAPRCRRPRSCCPITTST